MPPLIRAFMGINPFDKLVRKNVPRVGHNGSILLYCPYSHKDCDLLIFDCVQLRSEGGEL